MPATRQQPQPPTSPYDAMLAELCDGVKQSAMNSAIQVVGLVAKVATARGWTVERTVFETQAALSAIRDGTKRRPAA